MIIIIIIIDHHQDEDDSDDKDAVKAAIGARGKFKKLDLAVKSLKDIETEMKSIGFWKKNPPKFKAYTVKRTEVALILSLDRNTTLNSRR